MLSWRADPRGRRLADRHYSRQAVGHPQFAPPGRCLVLVTRDLGAVWTTSWPLADFVKHQWAGAWINSLFRRESGPLASELIRQAVAVTRWYFGEAPALGIVTFVDAAQVRRKRDPGRCYRKAGFQEVGTTQEAGLIALQLLPSAMPEPAAPWNPQLSLWTA